MLIVQESPALPVIDMSPFVAAQDDVLAITEAQLATAKEIHAACAQAGFFYVVGHGVSEEQATLLKTLARDFFSLEPETKARLSIYKNDMARGYQRLVCPP